MAVSVSGVQGASQVGTTVPEAIHTQPISSSSATVVVAVATESQVVELAPLMPVCTLSIDRLAVSSSTSTAIRVGVAALRVRVMTVPAGMPAGQGALAMPVSLVLVFGLTSSTVYVRPGPLSAMLETVRPDVFQPKHRIRVEPAAMSAVVVTVQVALAPTWVPTPLLTGALSATAYCASMEGVTFSVSPSANALATARLTAQIRLPAVPEATSVRKNPVASPPVGVPVRLKVTCAPVALVVPPVVEPEP